jgi:predicted RNase H-like HicB family nuclease
MGSVQTFTVVLSQNPERGDYSATIPAAPGAGSQGSSREEALANATEALELWLEVTLERGGHVLPESPSLIASEVEAVLRDREELGWDSAIETARIVAHQPVAA